jgi:ATP-dependent DNA helicase RecG
LVALNLAEIEQIRSQKQREDWSSGICEGARVEDLEPAAVAFAREEYRKKHSHLANEMDAWDMPTFLNKLKVCVDGQITRTALILLGRATAERFLAPAVARITWVLKDAQGNDKDYQHFDPPLILAVEQVFSKVRNLTYRHMPNEGLFPREVTQYDPWVIRETLHNCIAHQNYTLGGRITLVELEDVLLFTNLGDFLPGSVEEVIHRDAPPAYYRNRMLADAMVNFNMIDTIGSGIRRMFRVQRERNFPMPDFDLSSPRRVEVRIPGRILDERYTRILMTKTDLTLPEVIALDKVQKKKSLSDEEFNTLKKKKLVEGRRPNLFVSAEIAAITESKVDYIRNLPLEKEHYKNLITRYLETFGEAKRADIDRLLLDKLSEAFNDRQKGIFVRNLLQEMKRDGTIRAVGANRWVKWSLSKSIKKEIH